MRNVTFKIIAHNSQNYKEVVSLREDVLRKPLGLSFSSEELEKEKDHVHIAGFIDNRVVATVVLVPEKESFKMQRVAVRTDFQKRGIASAMMKFCEDYARQEGFKEIYCHARNTAVSFYLKNQYAPEGDMFFETTIPHLKMRKIII